MQLVLLDEQDTGDAVGVRIYYSPAEVIDDMNIADLVRAGGIMLHRARPSGRDAQAVIRAVGERATVTSVRQHEAALVWADPSDGTGASRSFDLHWSDGDYDYIILGGTDGPDEVVDMARSMFCP